MKKLTLFSLIFCFGALNMAMAAPTCTRTPDGKVVCNYVDTGGGYEKDLCYKVLDKEPSQDEIAKLIKEGWFVGKVENGKATLQKKIGSDCTAGKTGAKKAECIANMVGNGKRVASCAAHECKSDYLLYTTNKRSEIPVAGKSEKVGSQGLCRKKDYLKSLCDAGCGCNSDERCVLNEVTVTNHGKSVKAFIGEEMCVCEKTGVINPNPIMDNCEVLYPNNLDAQLCCKAEKAGQLVRWNKVAQTCECLDNKNNVDVSKKFNYIKGVCESVGGNINPLVVPEPDEEECWYEFRGKFRCNNGKYLEQNKKITLTKEERNGMKCDEFKRQYGDDSAEVKALFEKHCGGGSNYVVIDNPTAPDVSREVEKINALMGKMTVWRDAEGKFNTARLASDATAGVVLGTVGGIVSSKIIKKKQLEKGFGVLHCTIGGQNVADYGDTFQVTYQR